MPTVFLVNVVDDDTRAALQYGDFRHINHRYVYGDEINNEKIPTAVEKAMAQHALVFNPAEDYLLIAGDHLQLVAFSAMLGRLYGQFRVLRWDKKAQGYLSVWIDAR